MVRLKQFLGYFGSAVLGSLFTVVAFCVCLFVAVNWFGFTAISFNPNVEDRYTDIEILDSALRNGTVYVRFKNTGAKIIEGAIFEVEVRNADGILVGEHEGILDIRVPPGSVEEGILRIYDRDGKRRRIDGDVSVKIKYGLAK